MCVVQKENLYALPLFEGSVRVVVIKLKATFTINYCRKDDSMPAFLTLTIVIVCRCPMGFTEN